MLAVIDVDGRTQLSRPVNYRLMFAVPGFTPGTQSVSTESFVTDVIIGADIHFVLMQILNFSVEVPFELLNPHFTIIFIYSYLKVNLL